ncbi:hypothetical protein L211DRAFT_854052 [Terfezia boudieri ATCC MYA-4762]|uniref:DUF913-domain-containing protein n=1 Tax=Terfezia boudieri ATCC MYA-4762 TaxID=1051890 RepID=A0A3N4L6L6_9PEZI|nr:hypothetical protein L211DRAFT_854052 [Terfezia boudieri ATCC MYA-4762]
MTTGIVIYPWLNLIDAIASLIEEDSHLVFEALDGKAPASEDASGIGHDINYRDEPVAFFFVLFGIAFEALVGRPGDGLATKEQTLAILLALKKILHPSVCGYAVYQDAIFSETMDLLDRLVLTEGIPVQSAIVGIARGLCVGHPTAKNRSKVVAAQEENLTEDVDQLFELTRIIVLVLAGILPNFVDPKTPARNALSEDSVNLIKVSLDALVDAADYHPGDNNLLKAAEIAIPAVKNCLTSATIILTAGINVIPPSNENIPRLLDNILEAFRDSETSRTAINAIRK